MRAMSNPSVLPSSLRECWELTLPSTEPPCQASCSEMKALNSGYLMYSAACSRGYWDKYRRFLILPSSDFAPPTFQIFPSPRRVWESRHLRSWVEVWDNLAPLLILPIKTLNPIKSEYLPQSQQLLRTLNTDIFFPRSISPMPLASIFGLKGTSTKNSSLDFMEKDPWASKALAPHSG